MVEIAKNHKDQLGRIKDEIRRVHEAWDDNFNRFHMSRNFIFSSSIDTNAYSLVQALGKPPVQANVLEAYLSRQCAEFDSQEPSIYCHAKAGDAPDDAQVDFLQGYCKRKLYEVKKNNTQFKTFQEQMSGGFSVYEIYTDYVNRLGFEQDIFFKKVENPTLCGFDLMAEEPHKADGRFCFKVYPLLKDDFELQFPGIDVSDVNFSRTIEGFTWAYKANEQEVLIVCDWYEKKIND